MPNLEDSLPEQPYLAEAKRRVAERRKELGLYDHARLDDDAIAQLMAEYASVEWLEGHDDGYSEGEGYGFEQGYAAAECELGENCLWRVPAITRKDTFSGLTSEYYALTVQLI